MFYWAISSLLSLVLVGNPLTTSLDQLKQHELGDISVNVIQFWGCQVMSLLSIILSYPLLQPCGEQVDAYT